MLVQVPTHRSLAFLNMDVYAAFLGLFLAVFLATTSNSNANDVSRCPTDLPRDRYLKAASGWDKCYRFHVEERSWKVAAFVCRREGGRLLTVQEERIQRYIVGTLSDLKWPRRGLWLGASDKRSEMDWEWITGEMVHEGYSNWAPGQPSCGILCLEDCAMMRWQEKDGRWHDYACKYMENYSFVCQFDMLPPPPTTKPPTTRTTTTRTTTTTTTSTTTTPSTTTTMNTTAREVRMLKKIQSGNLLNGSARKNHSTPNVYPYGSKDARHGQVKQVENQSAGLTSGSLVGLVVGILIGLSCAVCFIFFILLRRRKRKQEVEKDPRISYDNPYYAETPNVIYRAGGNRRQDNNDDDNDDLGWNGNGFNGNIGCASGGCDADDDPYLKPQKPKGCSGSSQETLKMKLPPPPSPLHSKPKLVMNNYDTPPALSAPTRLSGGSNVAHASMSRNSKNVNGGRRSLSRSHDPKNKSGAYVSSSSDEEEHYYTDVDPSMGQKYLYDVPQSRNDMDYSNGAACASVIVKGVEDNNFDENDYYNNEENMYESLEHLTGVGAQGGEETARLMGRFSLSALERDEDLYEDGEAIYENETKENNYVPLKTEENIYF